MRRLLLAVGFILLWISSPSLAATLTFFADTGDGYIQSSDAVYLTARSGSNLTVVGGASQRLLGQALISTTYYDFELFLSYDTSSIGASATITSAVLSLYGDGDSSSADFTANARLYDWGATLTTADYIPGASLSGNTLLATWASSGYVANYNDFTSQAAFVSSISKTGSTRMVLSSSRQEAGNTPTGTEYVAFQPSEASGTTQDPKLVVVTASSAKGGSMSLMGAGR